MPFEIVRNDITKMTVDAIVNTANPRPVIGSGVDSAIHEKAGGELLRARQKIGCIQMGCAANYYEDRKGTAVIYEAVSEAVCSVRASHPMSKAWKRNIDEDFKKRQKQNR